MNSDLFRSLTSCPSCGWGGGNTIYKINYKNIDFTVQNCKRCDVCFTNPAIKDECMQSFYQRDGFYSSGIGIASNPLVSYLRKNKLRWYVRKLKLNQTWSILDYGCGDGQLVEALRDEGFDAVGVDFQLSQKQESLSYFKRYDQIESDSLGKFDVIILRHTLEHVNVPNDFLKSLAKKFACNHFIVEVPNFETPFRYLFGKNYSQLAIPGHLYHFTVRSLMAAIKDFDVQSTSNTSVVVFGKSLFKQIGIEVNDMGFINVLFYPIQLFLELFFVNKTAFIAFVSLKVSK